MKVSTKPALNQNETLIISYLSLRKSVGILGVALPFVLVIGTFVFSDCGGILPSISQYYYSVVGDLLVGTLCGVAIFLFSYRGYEFWDRILSNAAGFFAVGAAFFPTHRSKSYIFCYNGKQDCTDFADLLHTITAGLFFITLAIISIWFFTKTNGNITPEKLMRNKIYRICGYTMLTAISLIGLYRVPAVHVLFQKYTPTVILETIALCAFGFSWLTKGEFLLKDE